MSARLLHVSAVALSLACAVAAVASADDTSSVDKLRILYSSRFTFTDQGLPLVTVEIMGGQREIHLHAAKGVLARPDGPSGSSIEAEGTTEWVIRAEHTSPALVQEWTVVETLQPDDTTGVAAAIDRWKARGFDPKAIEVGTIFGVGGELIDTRETRIAVEPVAAGQGNAHAQAIAKRFGVATSVHAELERRPAGTIVAQSGKTIVRNPSVLWFDTRGADQTITVANVVTGGGGSQLETGHEDRRYWGSVYVTLDRNGDLVAVNAVSEDKLLDGLVPAEMFAEAPAAALQAQAIAARTELLSKIGHRNPTDPFLICSTQACQVYAGAGKEDPRTTKAVEKTRGMVILRDGGGIADPRYSASCGGYGEDNDHIWGGAPDPSLRGHPDGKKANISRVTDDNIDEFLGEDPKDSWCGHATMGANRFRWTERVTADQLSDRIRSEFPNIGRVVSFETKDRGVSGRINTLVIHGDKATVNLSGDLHIRRLLGGLKSSLFKIEVEGAASAPTAFVFHGAGFGHGVGMCQTGAIGMAEAGKEHAEILKHYYPSTHLHRMY